MTNFYIKYERNPFPKGRCKSLAAFLLCLILAISSFPGTALAGTAAEQEAADPQAAVYAIAPPSGKVGKEYKEKLFTFMDQGRSRSTTLWVQLNEDQPKIVTIKDEASAELVDGLTFQQDGTVSGTPDVEGVISIRCTDATWEGSDYKPTFVKKQDLMKITIYPRDTKEQIPSTSGITEVDKAKFFDKPIVPSTTGQWYSFKAPCLNISLVDESEIIDTSEEDGSETAESGDTEAKFQGDITIYDKNGFKVESLGEDKNDPTRMRYYLSAGAQYYVFAKTPFSLQPAVKNVSEIGTGENFVIWYESKPIAENISRTFEDEENTLWDVYTVHTSFRYNMGLLDYGYMYACGSVTYVAPYKAYFDDTRSDFTQGTDVYSYETDVPNEVGSRAYLHSSEQKSAYTSFHYLTSNDLVDGIGSLTLSMYVPTGRKFVVRDGVIRDTESKDEPASVGAAGIIGRTNVSDGILIQWEKAVKGAGYELQRRPGTKENDETAWKTIATFDKPTKTSYTDKTVTEGAVYHYRIRTLSNNDYVFENRGYSKYCAIARLSTPTLRSAVNKKKKKIIVKWNTKSKCDGYQVVYTTSTLEKGKNYYITSPRTGAYTLTKLTKGKTYKVYVRSYKKYKVKGEEYRSYSDWSSVAKVRINK